MRKPRWPFPLMATWSPKQKLAVYDLCQLISETLWQNDRDNLLQAMILEDQQRGFKHASAPENPNLELPFDDDLPF
jgi:hypothetical protein